MENKDDIWKHMDSIIEIPHQDNSVSNIIFLNEFIQNLSFDPFAGYLYEEAGIIDSKYKQLKNNTISNFNIS